MIDGCARPVGEARCTVWLAQRTMAHARDVGYVDKPMSLKQTARAVHGARSWSSVARGGEGLTSYGYGIRPETGMLQDALMNVPEILNAL